MARQKEPFVSGTTKILLAAATIFILLKIAAILFFNPGDRVWGLDYARYILSWDVWLALMLPLAACIPTVAKGVARLFRSSRNISGFKYYFAGVLLTGTLLYGAYEFRVAFPFLGDGSLCIGEIYRIRTIPGYEAGLFDKPSTYGAGQVLKLLAFADSEFQDTSNPFFYLSLIALCITVPLLLLLLRGGKGRITLLLFVTFLATPALLFYFGYVELYVLQYAFLCLFFASAFNTLSSGKPLLIPFLFLLLSVLFGASSLIYVPAAVFLIATNVPHLNRYRNPIAMALITGIAAMAILLPLVRDFESVKPYVLSLTNGQNVYENGIFIGWEAYGIFSGAHLADILNIVVMLGGIAFVFALILIPASIRANIWSEPLMQFAQIAGLAGCLMLVEGHAQFGLARDWDLAVAPMLGISFLGAMLLIALDTKQVITLPHLLPVILLSSLSIVYIWSSLNHSGQSARRLESLIEMNENIILPGWSLNGYENLRKYYRNTNNDSTRFSVLLKMAGTGWNVEKTLREAVTLAAKEPDPSRASRETGLLLPALIHYGRKSFGKNDYRFAPERSRSESLASMVLIMHAYKPAIAASMQEAIRAEYPDWPMVGFITAATDPELPPAVKTARMEAFIDTNTSNAHLFVHMGNQYHLSGQPRNAIQCLHRSLALDTENNIAAYGLLAKIHTESFMDVDSSILQLERGIRNCRLHPDVPKYSRILTELRAYQARATGR